MVAQDGARDNGNAVPRSHRQSRTPMGCGRLRFIPFPAEHYADAFSICSSRPPIGAKARVRQVRTMTC